MRAARATGLAVVLFCVGFSGAVAHPLGNFTINHLAKISSRGTTLHVRYILDIAEIPAFQMLQTYGGRSDASSLETWALAERIVVLRGLHVTSDGSPVVLNGAGVHASVRPGAGGLPILRWVGHFTADVAPGTHAVTLVDDVYSDRRIGWKDLIAGDQREPTNELRSYPSALIGSPRRVSSITFQSADGAISSIRRSADETTQISSSPSWLNQTLLSDMFSRPGQTPLFVLLTILVAFGLGALHAVEPGHGKALLAFTLVGARATSKQALILAASLTLAHTIGVFVLGGVLFFAGAFVSESIYPWITLVSGAVIAMIGARSLARYVQSRHGHRHEHPHSHHDGHDHAIPGSQPLNFGSAVWAAMSGGVAPCPAAIVVLLAALRLHHLGYGMLLVVVFSLGLAGVLSGLGLGVVRGAAWLSNRSSYARFAAYGPLITASIISIIGSVMLAQGMRQEGVVAPVAVIALVSVAAIVGFALSQHSHHHHHSHLSEGATTV